VGKFYVTKTYGHDEGLSCCFRQWRASSHCSKLHGYAIGVKIVIECDSLDARSWVVDFGAFGAVRSMLHDLLDHTVLVATDDPHRDRLEALQAVGLIDLRLVDSVGCESFAKLIFDKIAATGLVGQNPSARVASVEVSEHGGNTAGYSNA
jgi:6-pyruvoyltetrahydropterin/6-carboxytetrahydropterin synthase